LAVLAAAVCPVTLFWFLQGENLFHPMQFYTIFCNTCLIAALTAFARQRLVPCIGFALLATFSSAHGMVIWPVLLLLGVAARRPARQSVAVGVCFAAALMTYLAGYESPDAHTNPIAALGQPVAVLKYIVLFLGLPILGVGSGSAPWLAVLLVGTGLLAWVVSMARYFLSRSQDHTEAGLVYSGVSLAALASAAITALGRVNLSAGQALSGRYATLALLFWLGFALWLLHRWSVARPRAAGALAFFLMAASAATIPTHIARGVELRQRGAEQEVAALSMMVGAPDTHAIAQYVNPKPDLTFRYVQRLRARRQSFIARPETAWLGKPLAELFRIVPQGSCEGVFDQLRSRPGAAQTLGWAWDRDSGDPFDWIVFSDPEGIIRGLARTRLDRADVAQAFDNPEMAEAGWRGTVAAPPGSPPPAAYGVSEGRRSACPIGLPRSTSVLP
jgi:hypothetical protein